MAKATDTVPQFQQILTEIKSGKFSPVYLLQGDETFFVDEVTSVLENTVVPPESRSFNQTVVYGKEVSSNELIGICRRYPMMSDYQLVVVKDAQDLKEVENLVPYLENPLTSTVLVLVYRSGKLDMRSKFAKSASKYTTTNFSKLRDYQIKDWLPKFAKMKGKVLDQDATQRLLDLIGADLSVIHNELEKIFASVKDEFIKIAHVDEQVGFNREYNVFELQSALAYRNFNKSIQIAHQMGQKMERGEMMRVFPVLFAYFNRILLLHNSKSSNKTDLAKEIGVNPYFMDEYFAAKGNYTMIDLEKVMNILKYLDLRLKGINRGNATDGDLLVETVVNILKK